MGQWCFVIACSLGIVVLLYVLLELHYFLRMCLCVVLARFVKKKTHILDTTTVSEIQIQFNDMECINRQFTAGSIILQKVKAVLSLWGCCRTIMSILALLSLGLCWWTMAGVYNGYVCFYIGICLTTDIDTLLYHMNNARYLRELDFARVDFYERTQLYRTIVHKGGAVVQGAATIRYRRFIRPFARFNITSRIIYWDDTSVFMEHRFLTPSDNFINAIAICRQRILDCSAEDVMRTLLTPKATQLLTTTSGNTVSPTISLQNATMENIENGHINSKLKPEMPLEISKWIEYNEISSKNLRRGC